MKTYKGYQIKGHKEFPSMLVIVTEGRGGKIPDCLSGLFTSHGLCYAEIDKYLETKQKDTKNDKTVNEAGV